MNKIVKKISNLKLNIPIPIFGIGCGVLGLTLHKTSINIGKYASTLLKGLEYRGYDSTGAIFQDDKKNTVLLKDVGAPSALVKKLGIEKQSGKTFCGQVRWATFGKVDKLNAQPHEVFCKVHIYGAHNGNITNTRELKEFLLSEGHDIKSDNDGEMLIHMIEHYFAIELGKNTNSKDVKIRKKAMRNAILITSKKVIGSYAAVVVDPETEVMYTIKSGSSLYFGVGILEGEKFCLASSDLTVVLNFTKNIVELKEGDFVEFTADSYQIYAFKDYTVKKLNKPNISFKAGDKINRKPIRSKLRAEDTKLLPEFEYFMEQEINSEPIYTGKLIKLFQGGSNSGRHMRDFLKSKKHYKSFKKLFDDIEAKSEFDEQKKIFDEFLLTEASQKLKSDVKKDYSVLYEVLITKDFEKEYFFSSNKNAIIELAGKDFDDNKWLLAKVLDSLKEENDVKEFQQSILQFQKIIQNTYEKGRNIYALACGSSFHSAKIAALYFNEIAGTEVIPVLPGDFRGQYSQSLRDNDVIVGVSQSGETKDLVDIFNDVDSRNLNIKKIVLVNNLNSTLGQEKSDVSIPIYCGPEIAVPATKSFINQITLFYYLAIKTLEVKIKVDNFSDDVKKELNDRLNYRYKMLYEIPHLIHETIKTTKESIEYVASKIYMEPSMHIMATKISGVAKEGALKIRETVLNHTEGGEASEFKHGPNTILGKNTVFGMKQIKSFLNFYDKILDEINQLSEQYKISREEERYIIKALADYIFSRNYPFNLSIKATKIFKKVIENYDFTKPLYRNYPLIYVTGPDKRDVNLTTSQINTHKIRGADTFIIAEEDEQLLTNARINPNEENYYGWGYIMLPKTGDSLMVTFSASVALQLLALKMCEKKMNYLDRMNVADHGVHPDVPKNVSKSITVD